MAVDSVAERMAVAGVAMTLGAYCYPGTATTGAGRAAIAWSFVNGVAPPPPGGDGGLVGLVDCGTLRGSLAGGAPQCASNGNWLS